jgi:hypothetical protein
MMPEKAKRSSVHLDFEIAYWWALGTFTKGNSLPLKLETKECAYCQEPAKFNSFESIEGSISGQEAGSGRRILRVYLDLPLCEKHSFKDKSTKKPNKRKINDNLIAIILTLAMISLGFLLRINPFFAEKGIGWSFGAAILILLAGGIVILILVDLIRRIFKIGPPRTPPAVIMDGNLDFHFLRPESARKLQRQLDDSKASMERWKNRSIEEKMDDGSGFVSRPH